MGYPVTPQQPIAELNGQTNGRLSSSVLSILVDEPNDVTLCRQSMRKWKAMRAHAARDGIMLDAVGPHDSYRPYATQFSIFDKRYYRCSGSGCGAKRCGGVWYCKRDCGYATAACPGTSNHGWGRAVDVIRYPGVVEWLLRWADTYGWSWELQSEPWHIRDWAGDNMPAAVLAYEKGITEVENIMDWFIVRATNRAPMLVVGSTPGAIIGLTANELASFTKAGIPNATMDTGARRDMMRDEIRKAAA